jgi:phasin
MPGSRPPSKDHVVDENVQTPSVRAKSKPIVGSGTSPFEFPKFPTPNFELPKFEIPAEFREFAEKSASQAKETCEKMKNAHEEMSDRFKEAYARATKGAADYGVGLIEAAHANTNATFDYAIKLFSAKSLSDAIELSTAHLRQQFETLTEQSKSLSALAQKVANETAEPIKEGLTKAFKQAA